jgi:hypothetical protein
VAREDNKTFPSTRKVVKQNRADLISLESLTTIDTLEIKERLGGGAFGTVFKGSRQRMCTENGSAVAWGATAVAGTVLV